jgi:hypothetical protein
VNACVVKSVHGPGVVPQILNCCVVQSVQKVLASSSADLRRLKLLGDDRDPKVFDLA